MKQSELNQALNASLKEAAELHDWKFSRGFLFKKTELLFFVILARARANRSEVLFSLEYKWLAFDDLFWKVMKLEENARRPLSFHAAGAFTAPTKTILEGTVPVKSYDSSTLAEVVGEVVTRCDAHSREVSKKIKGIDQNLKFLEETDRQLKELFPETGSTISLERVLIAILKKDVSTAKRIIKECIRADDTGGFWSGNKTFYEMAQDYVRDNF